jgi:hypothetical protein
VGGRTAAAKGSRFAGVCQQLAYQLGGESTLGEEAGAAGEVATVCWWRRAEALAMRCGQLGVPVDLGLGKRDLGLLAADPTLAQVLADADGSMAALDATADKSLGIT